MDTSMHGRRVEYFQVQSQGNTVRPVGPGEGSLVLSATFNGDRDEFWILAKDKDGTEIGRFNCKFISEIMWVTPQVGHGG